MSVWSREELLSLLADWKAAYRAASTGKSYTIQGRALTRYDLPEIRNQLAFLDNELTALNRGGKGPVFVRARIRRPL